MARGYCISQHSSIISTIPVNCSCSYHFHTLPNPINMFCLLASLIFLWHFIDCPYFTNLFLHSLLIHSLPYCHFMTDIDVFRCLLWTVFSFLHYTFSQNWTLFIQHLLNIFTLSDTGAGKNLPFLLEPRGFSLLKCWR